MYVKKKKKTGACTDFIVACNYVVNVFKDLGIHKNKLLKKQIWLGRGTKYTVESICLFKVNYRKLFWVKSNYMVGCVEFILFMLLIVWCYIDIDYYLITTWQIATHITCAPLKVCTYMFFLLIINALKWF